MDLRYGASGVGIVEEPSCRFVQDDAGVAGAGEVGAEVAGEEAMAGRRGTRNKQLFSAFPCAAVA